MSLSWVLVRLPGTDQCVVLLAVCLQEVWAVPGKTSGRRDKVAERVLPIWFVWNLVSTIAICQVEETIWVCHDRRHYGWVSTDDLA